MKLPHFTERKLFRRAVVATGVVGVVGCVLAAAIAANYLVREQGEMIHDAYCLDWASAAILQYLDDNEGRYPQDWESLHAPFNKISDRSFSFEEVQSRTEINFAIDPQNPPEQLVWLRSGRDVHWGSPEPNERIHQRLRAGLPSGVPLVDMR